VFLRRKCRTREQRLLLFMDIGTLPLTLENLTRPSRPLVSVIVISKNEPALAHTLEELARQASSVASSLVDQVEILVVDASTDSVADVRAAHSSVHWIPFSPPAGVRVSIPHQRNRGVREAGGDVIVFTDCGCVPGDGWLAALLDPILEGKERMTCGQTGATDRLDPYRHMRNQQQGNLYLRECPTINLAFTRDVFEELGGFDESFEYGSDADFSWRAVHHGIRIRYVPEAMILHDWGNRGRQLKRSFAYGKARARLYYKHVFGRSEQSIRKRHFDENDAVPLLYPLYLLGLPLAIRHRWYLLLLAIPLWRARKERPLATLVDHFALGAGVLVGSGQILMERKR